MSRRSGHPLANAPPVGLDLGLTGTAQTHAAGAAAGTTTGLPGHRFTPASQARQHVFHLGKRDLGFTFSAGGVLSEDVEDQRGAVDDFDLDRLFQRGQLCRGQLAVADDGVGAGGKHDLAKLLRLAGADVGRRVGLVAALDESFEDLRAGGFSQCRQLGQAGLGVGGAALGPHADEHDAFQP